MQDWGMIFDWDGVLVDSSDLHRKSWNVLATELGTSVPDGGFERGFGMKNEVIIPTIMKWTEDRDEVLRLADRKERIYRELAADQGLDFLPGAKLLLKRLQAAGIPCVIGSSTERANLDAILNRNGGRGFFAGIVSGDDVARGKPDPEVFLKAHAALDTEGAVVIEDALPGIEAATRAGLPVVAVTTTHPAEELLRATLVVEDLGGLEVDHLATLARGRSDKIAHGEERGTRMKA